ncbi:MULTISPECIES: hypothetical protein [Enterococcus]|jgi:hypothetical protein|uniref:hypothetical protein n=1 Tax=Enterococcus TaxID=1350 RepID=UPI002713410B|nr:hypothetical protein [Enterococcus innesii]MDO7880206.1 hypothetical protein [Enterococcus mundtii]MEB5953042.1 hypothetical protein [Enterococcus innesii]
MALIDRKIPKNVQIEKQANTKRETKVDVSSRKVLKASERKNIKVSPETFNLIKSICTMKSIKNYEFIDEVVDYYIKNELTEREQRILNNLKSL